MNRSEITGQQRRNLCRLGLPLMARRATTDRVTNTLNGHPCAKEGIFSIFFDPKHLGVALHVTAMAATVYGTTISSFFFVQHEYRDYRLNLPWISHLRTGCLSPRSFEQRRLSMATTSVAGTCPGYPRRWNLSLSLHFFNAVFSNRPSLTVDPAEHLYLVGTTALPLPYEDKYEAAAFENSVFSHPLFLEKYLAFASVAAARIYGRISPVNLCYAMYYEVPRENSRDKSPS